MSCRSIGSNFHDRAEQLRRRGGGVCNRGLEDATMTILTAAMIGFLCGVAVTMLFVALVALWWIGGTVDQVQNFDDLEGEGRG